MSRGVNKVIIVGNLGNDPESKSLASGSMVTNISVATSESWKDRETGQQTDRTEWHRIVMFNRLAEISGQYLKKGSKVYIEGSLRTRKWQAQDGSDRYSTEIVANNLQMLDSRNSDSNPYSQPNQGFNQNNTTPQQHSNNSNNQSNQQQPYSPAPQSPKPAPIDTSFSDFDDDIPF
jgi:single-strand DNA-binding protein